MKKPENKQRLGLSKDEMINIIKILEHNREHIEDIHRQHFEANKKYMQLEQQLFHEKWKFRTVSRALKNVAKHLGQPDLAISEEELNEQIRSKEN
jgi:DNA-binding transcriptional regulator GbsR (MarR family)